MRLIAIAEPDGSARQPPPPALLVPHLVCSLDSAAGLLGLPASCLKRAARRGELKVCCRGGRYFTLGPWLLAWLEAGAADAEARRRRARS
jgi:hypothetical protein